jgi:hypothetical protein
MFVFKTNQGLMYIFPIFDNVNAVNNSHIFTAPHKLMISLQNLYTVFSLHLLGFEMNVTLIPL